MVFNDRKLFLNDFKSGKKRPVNEINFLQISKIEQKKVHEQKLLLNDF